MIRSGFDFENYIELHIFRTSECVVLTQMKDKTILLLTLRYESIKQFKYFELPKKL